MKRYEPLEKQKESSSSQTLVPPKLPEFQSDFRIFKNREERDKYLSHSFSEVENDNIRTKYREICEQFHDSFTKQMKWLERNPPQTINQQRKNISLLVIIGAGLKPYSGSYINNFQLLSNALLLVHIFQYVFGIPDDQILITSCEEHDFDPSNPNVRISPDSSPQKGQNDLYSPPSNKYLIGNLFQLINDFEFAKCVFSQVAEFQFQFIPDDDISRIIKPFNRLFIRKFLKTHDDTELFVFILNHASDEFFSPPNYNFYLERLNEIPVKHFIVFNECCQSGSLLELIDISRTLIDLLHKDNRELLINAFETILAFSVDKSNKTNEEKDLLYSKIQNLRPQYIKKDEYNKMIGRISSILSKYPNDYKIDPLLFVQFQEKASIFCSCDSNTLSFSLPIRDFYIGKDSAISSHGSIYISCVIECLLNNHFPTNPHEFVSQIQATFSKHIYQSIFQSLVREQNEYVDDECAKSLKTEELLQTITKCSEIVKQVDKFFKTDYTSSSTYHAQNDLPDMSSLLIPEQYWPIIITNVDEQDYQNLKVYHYSPPHQSTEVKPVLPEEKPYAPYSPDSDIWEFKVKFADYVQSHLPEAIKDYEFQFCLDHDATFDQEINDLYREIRRSAFKYINNYNANAIVTLEQDIKMNLAGSFKNHQKEFIKCCKDAYKVMLPLWNKVFLLIA